MRSLAEVLSDQNRGLLKVIQEAKPQSISTLAKLTGRKTSHLSRTLKTMSNYSFVEMRRESAGEASLPLWRECAANTLIRACNTLLQDAGNRALVTIVGHCAFGKMLSMNDNKLIEALSNASSLELFDLSRIIDRLLADPRRIAAVRSKLNLGKSVRFMDWRTGQMRAGRIVAIKDDQITVQDDSTRTQWRLSYAAIDPGEDGEPLDVESPAVNVEPPRQRPARDDFHRGDKVSFTDKYLQHQVGTISRINQRTASVECEAGSAWRVPFAMLTHVMDI